MLIMVPRTRVTFLSGFDRHRHPKATVAAGWVDGRMEKEKRREQEGEKRRKKKTDLCPVDSPNIRPSPKLVAQSVMQKSQGKAIRYIQPRRRRQRHLLETVKERQWRPPDYFRLFVSPFLFPFPLVALFLFLFPGLLRHEERVDGLSRKARRHLQAQSQPIGVGNPNLGMAMLHGARQLDSDPPKKPYE